MALGKHLVQAVPFVLRPPVPKLVDNNKKCV